MFKIRKPVHNLVIVPISLDIEQDTNDGAEKTYAIQQKKNVTPYVKNFQTFSSEGGDESLELHVTTKKSAVRLLVLERKRIQDGNNGSIREYATKKYKLRLSIPDLVYEKERSNDWKVLTVTMKDGNQLVLRSKRTDGKAPANNYNNATTDEEDLSTIIMNGIDDNETANELYLHLEVIDEFPSK